MVITSGVARSSARIAILTILGTIEEANTIKDLVKATHVQIASHVDPREARFAMCDWLQPRSGADWSHAYREIRLPGRSWQS